VTLVDSSVWIDYFRGQPSWETERLDRFLGQQELAIGDLILTEVLQGFVQDRDFRKAKSLLHAFPIVEIGGARIALAAAEQHRALRKRGITVRKTINTLIAARCIHDHLHLLTSDRDFAPFVAHFGLKLA
jgi:predicted nucleic acid-binding protein